MKIHRFIIDHKLQNGDFEIKDKEIISQISKVLRLKTGEKILLGDGKGYESLYEIREISKSSIYLSGGQVSKNENEPKKEVTMYLAILKRENFELSIQKATELGISKVVPIITERTVKTGFKRERLEKIIREASEQSGRGKLPTLEKEISFEKAIKDCNPKKTILFDLTGETLETCNLKHVTSFFIGPEGGFTDKEVESSKDLGLKIASFGKLTYRGETASIVGSFAIINSWE
jgi:16S rRNA (uracil1498-N3)-methyltransferase